MKIFIDTANIEEIKKANDWGVIDGVTTNPSLVAKEGREFKELIREIVNIVNEEWLKKLLSCQNGRKTL
jgi:transaldolase